MEKIISLLFFLAIATPAFAGNGSGNVSSVIGLGPSSGLAPTSYVPLTNLAGSAGTYAVFSVYASSNATAGNFYPLYKNGTAYQVTAGKTAYCFNFAPSAATGAIRFQIVSDTAAISFDQSTALTSGLFQGGAAARYPLRNSTTANKKEIYPGTFSIGASRYVAVQVSFSDIFEFSMDCYEQ